MKTYINLFGLVCFGITTVFLSGMGGCNEEPEVEPVAFTEAIPAAGSTIQQDATIIATFDGTPTDVNVTGGKFSVSGSNVTITGPFTPGTLTLTLTWSDGATALTYTVEAPEPDAPDPYEGMELIRAGEFRMGSNSGRDNEKPVHSVYVDAFYMDKYEVTNAEYAEFLNAKGKHADAGRTWLAVGHQDARIEYVNRVYRAKAGYENHPVTMVSWYGAMAYATWKGKRLPTEAEWEKAARGNLAGLKYPWGNGIDATKANYNNNDTTAVGKYTANGYGLYDMSGNVWEWCLDEYNRDFYAISPSQNPLSGANSVQWLLDNWTGIKSIRVMRGGGWGGSNTADLRCAYRAHPSAAPATTGNYLGFRCVRAVE